MELIVQNVASAAVRQPGAPAGTSAAPGPVVSGTTPAALLLTGRVLTATVLAAPRPGVVTLDVEGVELTARTALPLESGKSLTVRVESSNPTAVLKVLDDPAARADAALNAALRAALPRQQPIASAFRQIDTMLGSGAAGVDDLPPETARIVRDLVSWAPALRSLATPDALSRAIRDSGVLLEAKLAAAAGAGARPDTSNDLKALLLRALASFGDPDAGTLPAPRTPPPTPPPGQQAAQGGQPAPGRPADTAGRAGGGFAQPEPGTLERQVEGALYRVQARQLQSAQTAPDAQAWHVEIPVRTGRDLSSVELRIERRLAEAEDPDTAPWSVRVDVDLGARGLLHGQIALTGGAVSATLWADEDHTRALVEARLDELRDDLTAAGLEIGCIACRSSAPPPPDETPPPGALVRTRA